MKKISAVLVWLLAFFALAVPAAAASQEIADVPPNHWAYQAVKQLVSQGYLGLYPDKTFRGNQPVDRYTMAVVIARLLSEAVSGKTAMSKEDADLLRRLTAEFRQELVAVSMRTKTLEEAVARYENERKALGADLAAARDELAESAREIVAIKERVVRLEDSYAALSQETVRLEDSLETLSREVTSLGGKLGDLAAETKARDEANAAAIAEAGRFSDVGRKDLAELSQRMAILEDELRTWKYITAGLAILAGLLL